MKNIITKIALVIAAVSLTNCAPKALDSTSSSSVSATTDNNSLSDGSTGDSNISDTVAKLDLQGQVDSTNPSFGNALTFSFDKARGEFIIMLPLPSGVLFTPSGSFSKYPDITFSPMIDSQGRMKIGVRIPVKYIVKGLKTLPASALPNGDALPMMPQGYSELPSLALNLTQSNDTQITLYIGVNAVGLYVTLPTNAALPIGFTLPVKNKDKTKTFGYLSYVPAKGASAPGLFVSSIIPASVARILEDYFKL